MTCSFVNNFMGCGGLQLCVSQFEGSSLMSHISCCHDVNFSGIECAFIVRPLLLVSTFSGRGEDQAYRPALAFELGYVVVFVVMWSRVCVLDCSWACAYESTES